MAQLPSTTGSDGRILMNSGPPLHTGFKQVGVEGGPIIAASRNTINSINQHAAAALALGAGQKGSSRRNRRRRHRGGAQNLNVNFPDIPTANSIPGVSHAGSHIAAVNNLNQARWSAVYDKTMNAAPIKLTAGTRKRRGKSKRKTHGRRSKRTHRRIRH
jgi:hypothetical protein